MTYWQNRQQQLNKQMEKDEAKLKKRLSSFYDAEFARLEKEIAAYYQKYGKDNVIEYRRLMENLPDADKKLLIEQMDEFEKKYPQYADLIPVRESIYKLNRLEGLQYSIRMQQLEIGAVNNEQITAYLNKQAERGVNAAAEAMGFGKNFYANNPDITKLFVNVGWNNGKDFSQRIWENVDKLSNYLRTDIAQAFARGDSYDRIVRQLRERFSKVTRNDAYRLIYTEGTYVMAESTIQPFTEDFEKYKISTVEDGRVCPICKSIAKETFRISERQSGVNFPPFHPWCRCTFEIVVDDWDTWMDQYVAKHGTDKSQAQKLKNRFTSSESSDIMKLPRYQEAVIPDAKFSKYALNPEGDENKAKAFKEALGYTLENAEILMQQIYDELPNFPAKEKGDIGFGMRYEVVMNLKGPNGKTAKVLTAWIDDKKTGEMRLTTAYIDK